jgi:Domain of unknown function (DUF4391)
MELFTLPQSTKVQKVVPKNAFDEYTNSKQKKLFSDKVLRITWLNKLAPSTVNLEAKDVKEIQIFKIELKVKEEIKAILDIINKATVYHIIFIVSFEEEIYLSTSAKHPHPANENNAVIDWTFKTDWFQPALNAYSLSLKKSIDAVYHDFCRQLSAKPDNTNQSLQHLVQYSKDRDSLEKEIAQLKSKIKNANQFKIQVELNLVLNQKINELTQKFGY